MTGFCEATSLRVERHVPRPFASGRAIVPMTGYNDWVEAADSGKDPLLMDHPDGEPLHATGLNHRITVHDQEFWHFEFILAGHNRGRDNPFAQL